MSGFLKRRPVILGMVVGLCLVLTAAAFLLGRSIKSPAQRAAEAAPPEYSTVTASVEQRALQESLQLRGSASFSEGSEVLAAEVAGAGRLVVSDVGVEAGAEAESGDLLVAVSERPVFLLEGAAYAYRDMQPGMSGSDITQLQAALEALDYSIGDTDGYYGSSTKAAVKAFYEARGFSAPTSGDAEALNAARQAVEDAEDAHDDAEAMIAAEKQAVADALADLEAARAAEPPDEEAVAAAEALLEETEAIRDDNEPDLDAAADLLDEAEDALDDIESNSGAMVPLSEIVFASDLPAVVNTVAVSVNDIVVAGDPLLSLAQGNLGVSAEINAVDGEKVEPGMRVLLSANGEELEGTVIEVEQPAPEGEGEGAGEAMGGEGTIPILHVKAEIPPEWSGAEVWLTVILSETAAEVLAVPQTAVYTAADGTTSVLRQTDAGSVKVPVQLGSTGDGYIEVVSDDLAAGDVVVVGQR